MTFSKKKNNDGFSLVEIILVIAIAGLILSAAFNVFGSGIKSFFFTEEKAASQRETRFLTSYVTENVRNSSSIDFKDSYTTPPSGKAILGVVNSQLKYNDRIIIEFTETTSVSFSAVTAEETDYLDSLIINIDGKEKEIILNNTNKNTLTGTTTGSSYIVFDE